MDAAIDYLYHDFVINKGYSVSERITLSDAKEFAKLYANSITGEGEDKDELEISIDKLIKMKLKLKKAEGKVKILQDKVDYWNDKVNELKKQANE